MGGMNESYGNGKCERKRKDEFEGMREGRARVPKETYGL